ncbi:MAG: hypothetical protein ACFFEF_12120 [Candidatus Thorarchaeota archaeon]
MPEDSERTIEIDIIRSFGSAIIEFEAVLLQKFMMLSIAHSLITEKMFRKYLNQLHSKGYVTPLEFQGKRCWKRLVVEEDLEIVAELPPDEVRRLLQKSHEAIVSRAARPIPKDGLVSDSNIVATRIRQTMLEKLYAGKTSDPETAADIQRHARFMRRALSESKIDFLNYVRRNIPSILEPMEQMLNTKGEDILLLSLRIVGAS